jgi:hypothetical protein
MTGDLFYNQAADRARPRRSAAKRPVAQDNMKDGFAFLYPPPMSLRCGGGSLDIGSVCYPLEIFKKYDFLFEHFGVRNRSRGLQVVFQERPGKSPAGWGNPGGEEYAIDCGPGRVVLSSSSARAQFYALSTLLQALAFHAADGRMPVFSLRDAPVIAFRGAFLSGEEAVASDPSTLPQLLLRLALLKFNHLALPAAAGSDPHALASLARRTGMALLLLDPDPRSLSRLAPAGKRDSASPVGPAVFPEAAAEKMNDPAAWLDFFLAYCRVAAAADGRAVAWGDLFLSHPEWIRRIPRDVLVLNRGAGPGRGGSFKAAVLPFREHQIRQVLCPHLCAHGRFIPDARAAMERVDAAMAEVTARKLAGVLLAAGEGEGCSCLPAGAAMVRFHAGCRLWSGRAPGPGAFSLWALGHDEPDLFRVFSFLAQAEHRLPHAHNRYLFEDPLLAPFSRQGDPREIVAHYRKAALYLKKKEIAANGMTGFLAFTARLYEVIAAKVQLSSRLPSLLETGSGGEAIRLQASGLRQAVMELKGLYAELRGGGAPEAGRKEFDELGERFSQLGRAAVSPAARTALLSALKNNIPLNAAETTPGSS